MVSKISEVVILMVGRLLNRYQRHKLLRLGVADVADEDKGSQLVVLTGRVVADEFLAFQSVYGTGGRVVDDRAGIAGVVLCASGRQYELSGNDQ